MDIARLNRLQSVLRFQSSVWTRRVRSLCGRTAMLRAASAVLEVVGARALAAAAAMGERVGRDEAEAAERLIVRMPLYARDGLRRAFLPTGASHHPEYSERLVGGLTPSRVVAVAVYRWSSEWNWAAVTGSQAQFIGHRQPRVPAMFGCYARTDRELVIEQARLAAGYGIGAFCIDAGAGPERRGDGATAAEVFALMDDPGMPLQVCVHFDRRSEPTSTTAWRQVLTHPRCLKVDGRPVVLVDASATDGDASQWRAWLAKTDIDDVHLVAVSGPVPTGAGYDAEVRLWPGQADTRMQPTLLNSTFAGAVSLYADDARLLLGDEKRHSTSYPAVAAAMDDSPLAREHARISADAAPSRYAAALHQACARAVSQPDRTPLVFLQSWNDWLHGAVLEPDCDNGFAFLEQTRQVLEQFGAAMPDHWQPHGPDIAVILHLHYPELWPEISEYLAHLPDGFRLYVSIGEYAAAACEDAIRALFPGAVIERLENRGRDLLPFVQLLARARADGCRFVCKIHSKKSLHRLDGDAWRRDLFDKLLGEDPCPRRVLFAFESRPSVGMIGPAGHMVWSDRFRGSNDARVRELATSLGFDARGARYRFAAGTMFWARMAALEPLLGLGLTRESFEEEGGQIDGTLAHALERVLPLSVRRAGMSVIDTGQIADGNWARADGRVDETYRWADSS